MPKVDVYDINGKVVGEINLRMTFLELKSTNTPFTRLL